MIGNNILFVSDSKKKTPTVLNQREKDRKTSEVRITNGGIFTQVMYLSTVLRSIFCHFNSPIFYREILYFATFIWQVVFTSHFTDYDFTSKTYDQYIEYDTLLQVLTM